MTQATLNSTVDTIYSDVEYITFSDFMSDEYKLLEEIEKHFDGRKIYIRGSVASISPEQIARKIQALTYTSSDGIPTSVRVNDPVTVYELNGEKFLLNGNTRKYSLKSLLANEKLAASYSNVHWSDVPVRYILAELTEDELKRLQTDYNDSTDSHRIIDVAFNLAATHAEVLEKAQSSEGFNWNDQLYQGLSQREAFTLANQYVAQAYNKSAQQVSQYLQIANLDPFLVAEIEKGSISPDMARQLAVLSQNVAVPIRPLFEQAFSLAPEKAGIVRVTKSVMDKLKAQYKPAEPAAVQTGEGEAKGDTTEKTEKSKVPSDFVPEKAMKTIEDTLLLTLGLDLTSLPDDPKKTDDLLINGSKGMIRLVDKMAATNLIKPSKAIAAFEALRSVIKILFDDKEVLTGISSEELIVIQNAASNLGKPLSMLLSATTDPVTESDESDDESDESDDETLPANVGF